MMPMRCHIRCAILTRRFPKISYAMKKLSLSGLEKIAREIECCDYSQNVGHLFFHDILLLEYM